MRAAFDRHDLPYDQHPIQQRSIARPCLPGTLIEDDHARLKGLIRLRWTVDMGHCPVDDLLVPTFLRKSTYHTLVPWMQESLWITYAP
jgi:hypothetical protein